MINMRIHDIRMRELEQQQNLTMEIYRNGFFEFCFSPIWPLLESISMTLEQYKDLVYKNDFQNTTLK